MNTSGALCAHRRPCNSLLVLSPPLFRCQFILYPCGWGVFLSHWTREPQLRITCEGFLFAPRVFMRRPHRGSWTRCGLGSQLQRKATLIPLYPAAQFTYLGQTIAYLESGSTTQLQKGAVWSRSLLYALSHMRDAQNTSIHVVD